MDKRKNSKRKKQVYQYDFELNLIAIYESTSDAAEKLGFSQGNIVQACNRAILQTNGYFFSYVPLTEPPTLNLEKYQQKLRLNNKACRKYQHNPQNHDKLVDNYYKRTYNMTKAEFKEIKQRFLDELKKKKEDATGLQETRL